MPARRIPLEVRFWSKVDKTETCWIWTGATHPFGHGHIKVDGEVKNAHRVSYEIAYGPIPDGLHIDHLCRNPGCVRPDHLEPVTPIENVMRGESGHAVNARKTHCVRGHEFTPENTYEWGSTRACRTCRKFHADKANANR